MRRRRINIGKALKAYQETMHTYQEYQDIYIRPAPGGAPWCRSLMATDNYAAKPMIIDFLCDVDLILHELFDKGRFTEERAGALFVKRNLYPLAKYFQFVRKKKENEVGASRRSESTDQRANRV